MHVTGTHILSEQALNGRIPIELTQLHLFPPRYINNAEKNRSRQVPGNLFSVVLILAIPKYTETLQYILNISIYTHTYIASFTESNYHFLNSYENAGLSVST